MLIVVNNWTSQIVLAEVLGEILESVGYNVEYKTSDTQLQYTAMGNGDMHVQVEVWEGTMKTPFEKEVNAGRMAMRVRTRPQRVRNGGIRPTSRIFAPGCPVGRR